MSEAKAREYHLLLYSNGDGFFAYDESLTKEGPFGKIHVREVLPIDTQTQEDFNIIEKCLDGCIWETDPARAALARIRKRLEG